MTVERNGGGFASAFSKLKRLIWLDPESSNPAFLHPGELIIIYTGRDH